MNECAGITCIFSEIQKKGLCVGIARDLDSATKNNVINLCWINRKPTSKQECDVILQARITPAEAVGIGVALIQSSFGGEFLLRNIAQAEALNQTKGEKHEKETEKNP